LSFEISHLSFEERPTTGDRRMITNSYHSTWIVVRNDK